MAELYNTDFDLPLWLIEYYHIISVISTIVSISAMYVILTHSGRMDGYKFYLFYSQLAGMIMDLHLTTFMQFVPLFPVLGGYCVGLMTTVFKISESIQTALTSFVICLVASAINCCFFRKHQGITVFDHRFRFTHQNYWIVFFLLNAFPFFSSSLLYMSMLNKDEQELLIHQNYPNLVEKFHKLPNFIVFEGNVWAIVFFAVIFFGCFYTICVVGLTTWHMFKILRDNRRKISVSKFEKHQAAIKSLVAQSSTSLLVIVPASFFSFLVVIRYEYCQSATHWSIVLITTHSIINAIVMLSTYPPYRRYLISLKGKRRIYSVSAAHSHVGRSSSSTFLR